MNDSIYIHLPETREELFSSPVSAPTSSESNTQIAPQSEELEKSKTQISIKEETIPFSQISTQNDTPKVAKNVAPKVEPIVQKPKTEVVVSAKEVKAASTPKSENYEELLFKIEEKESSVSDTLAVDSLQADSALAVQTEVMEIPKTLIISKEGTPRVPTVSMSVWYTPFLFFLFLAFMYVLSVRIKVVKSEVVAFFNPSAVGSIFSSEWQQNSPYKFTLSCAAIAVIGLFAFFASHGGGCTLHSFQIIASVGAVGLICMMKFGLINMVQYTYCPEHSLNFSSAFMTIVRLTGMCLIPAVLVMSYAPDAYFDIAMYYGLGVVIVAKILMIGKAVVNFFNGITSIFYLILYLCTLEALPLAGLCAFLMNIKYIF